jgi:hypothetical protein
VSIEDFVLGGNLEPATDPSEVEAVVAFQEFFEDHREQVFFSRQLEVWQRGAGTTGSPTGLFGI